MSLFNISIQKRIKKDKKESLKMIYNQLTDNKDYRVEKNEQSFTIHKCKLNTVLHFNTTVSLQKDELIIEAQLHDTLLLTIIIVLAIILTYGIGVIFVVAFAYLQKRKATTYLNDLLKQININ